MMPYRDHSHAFAARVTEPQQDNAKGRDRVSHQNASRSTEPAVHRFAAGWRLALAGMLLAASGFAAPAEAAASKDYGKKGEAIELVVGYQPYYTESWSGVIMRDKKFY